MKYFRHLITMLLLGMVLFSCNRGKELADKNVVAKVGRAELTLDELRERLPEMGQERVSVDQMKGFILQWVNSQVAYQQALNEGLHNTYREDLTAALKQLETEYLANKIIEREIKRDIKITDEEIQAYYRENTDRFKRATTEIRVIHLLISSPDTAALIRQKIQNGTALIDIVGDYSTQTPIWPNGDLGYFPLNAVPDNFRTTLSRMRPGTTTRRPITSEFGSHFFQLIDKQDTGTVREIEQVRSQIVELLKSEKRRHVYHTYLANLRTQAEENNELLINYEPLKKMVSDTSFVMAK